MILEGLMTTVNADGSVNIAPMGPVVDAAMNAFCLRPFQTSTTFANLKRTGQGVFHITDDVEMIARAAVGTVVPPPALEPARAVEGWILSEACRWYALRVRRIDDRQQRTEIEAEAIDRGRLRDFFGFNRAKHAVLEAAILATRIHLLSLAEIQAEIDRLRVPVQKTGGDAEQRAFEFLADYVTRAGVQPDSPPERGS
ncbi:MAG TPA: DUF447 domain-containing protein [Pirellulales bacterium]|jgi:hypothetical protein|nr:DUF447 domain-containing protein [Pirellulales bacterium]